MSDGARSYEANGTPTPPTAARTMNTQRDVAELIYWLESATPNTLVPAGELLEQVRSLPVVLPPKPSDDPAELLTADDVAGILKCDRQRVYRMQRDGRLPVVKIGGRTVRFRQEDVQAWIDSRRRENE